MTPTVRQPPVHVRVAAALAVACVLAACASAGSLEQRAADHGRRLHPDSLLVRDEGALYRAATMHSVPGDAAYDVERAIALHEAFISRFPASPARAAAAERLALLHEIQALRLQLRGLKDIDTNRRP